MYACSIEGTEKHLRRKLHGLKRICNGKSNFQKKSIF